MAKLNAELVAAFNRLANLLEIKGENPFKIRAYRNAARTIEGLGRSVEEMVRAGEDLTELPGIGKDLAQKIKDFVETGRIEKLEELEREIPAPLLELLSVEGLGPKRIRVLYENLGIKDLDQLRDAAQSGAIEKLPGFGPKIVETILKGTRLAKKEGRRFKWAVAEEYVEDLLQYLNEAQGVEVIEVAGSFRRKKETVGDLDVLVVSEDWELVTDHFVRYPHVKEVISKGKTRSTVILTPGIQVDLRSVPRQCYGAALAYFTGSKAHNIAIRTMGVKLGLKINEYGVFRGDERIGGEEELDVYKAVGLPFIEPELRENSGEIEAAQAGRLPNLIRLEDIRGDLHCHSHYTDGKDTIWAIATAAKALGYEYIAITDHSKRLTVTKGLDEKRLREQMEEIDQLNERLDGITILKSIEVDILEDGSLDLPDEVLRELDLVVGSIHHKFKLSQEAQTARVLKAMDNPHFTILGHPTGRLIGQREPYKINVQKVLEGAKERGCFLELNAQPDRLDLNDVNLRLAKEIGVKIAISTDSHSIGTLAYMRYGVNQARRGWIEKGDCINTRSLPELKQLLKR